MATDEQATPDFGVKMRRLREERGVSLRQIADVTRISVSALEALERNDISRLPGGIFSRAFVRSYALEVGLDPEETVREFLDQFPHETVIAGSPHAVDLQRATGDVSRVRPFWIIGILLVLGGIAFFALTALR
jgi:cytoskeleton protein RodZ